MPGLAIGAKLYLGHSQGNTSTTSWGIGPQVVYFIGAGKEERKFYPFLKGTLSYFESKGKIDSLKIGPEHSSSLSLGGGILYMLSERAGLSIEAIYGKSSAKREETKSGNLFSIMGGISVFLAPHFK